jgi:hypothetical protein
LFSLQFFFFVFQLSSQWSGQISRSARLGLPVGSPLPLGVLRVAEHSAILRIKAQVFRPVFCSDLQLPGGAILLLGFGFGL